MAFEHNEPKLTSRLKDNQIKDAREGRTEREHKVCDHNENWTSLLLDLFVGSFRSRGLSSWGILLPDLSQ